MAGCTSCPNGQETSTANDMCVCKAGWIKTFSASTFSNPTSCIQCAPGQTSSSERLFCIACPTNSTTTNLSTTCNCGINQILTFNSINAISGINSIAQGTCKTCDAGYYPSLDKSECLSCPQPELMVSVFRNDSSGYDCNCRTELGYQLTPMDGICLTVDEFSSFSLYLSHGYEVNYNNILSSDLLTTSTATIFSDIFSLHFMKAYTKCHNQWDFNSCQTLSNLCVLQLYDESSQVCTAYQALAKSRKSRTKLYPDEPEGIPWLYYGLLTTESSLTTVTKVPNVTLDISATMESSTLNFVLASYTIDGKFLGLRNLSSEFQFCDSDQSWLQVGHNFNTSCTLNIFELADQNSTIETIFHDLYLRQSNGKLFPVPVRIQNFLQEGVYVNLQKSEISSTPMDNSIASALFTDFGDDRLTRRFFLVDTLSGVQDGKLMVLRVATKIKVWITKSPRADGQIYSPIVDIYYSERHAPELALNDNSLFSSLVFNFEVIYRMDQSYFWSIMLIIFVILSLVATFLAFYEAKKFSSFNLEPQDVNQCRIDIFFMDWEKSKGKVIHHLQHDASETTLNTSSVRDVPISIWRTIFVANQWNALQSFRRINVTFTLVLMFSLMYGIKLRYLATPQPDATNLSVDKTNPILLFSINTVIWGALCTVQWMIRYLITDRFYRHRILQYVDLLSLSNISLVVLNENCQGYYIHGRSSHGYSDTSMTDLNENLRKEENDIVPKRGLNDTDKQGFELILSQNFRDTFNKIYNLISNNHAMNFRQSLRMRGKLESFKKKEEPMFVPESSAVEAHLGMNRFLCSFFDKNLKEFQYQMKEKSYFQKYFGVASSDLRDDAFHSTSVGSTLFHGIIKKNKTN